MQGSIAAVLLNASCPASTVAYMCTFGCAVILVIVLPGLEPCLGCDGVKKQDPRQAMMADCCGELSYALNNRPTQKRWCTGHS